MFRFIIRDLLWVVLAAALLAGWYHDRAALKSEAEAERRRNDENVKRLTTRIKLLEWSIDGVMPPKVPGLGDL